MYSLRLPSKEEVPGAHSQRETYRTLAARLLHDHNQLLRSVGCVVSGAGKGVSSDVAGVCSKDGRRSAGW